MSIPLWNKCDKASCWNGSNAQNRMMNMLSPLMPEARFVAYMNWMKSRGANTAHLFMSNAGDGEFAGYSIYGKTLDWSLDPVYHTVMLNRIKTLRKNGFGIVLWLFADDSAAMNREAKKNFPKYLADLKALGFLTYASTVVLGLELDEYFGASDVAKLATATRAVYKGMIGTHQASGFSYAGVANIVFYQVSPGKSAAWIQAEAARVKRATGKHLNFFELARNPARDKCEAAMRGGAFGVGNW